MSGKSGDKGNFEVLRCAGSESCWGGTPLPAIHGVRAVFITAHLKRDYGGLKKDGHLIKRE